MPCSVLCCNMLQRVAVHSSGSTTLSHLQPWASYPPPDLLSPANMCVCVFQYVNHTKKKIEVGRASICVHVSFVLKQRSTLARAWLIYCQHRHQCAKTTKHFSQHRHHEATCIRCEEPRRYMPYLHVLNLKSQRTCQPTFRCQDEEFVAHVWYLMNVRIRRVHMWCLCWQYINHVPLGLWSVGHTCGSWVRGTWYINIPHELYIICHLAHRRVCGAHMWCLSSWLVVYQCSTRAPTLHKPSVCHVAGDMECGRIHRCIACHELNTPHVCPTHPSVCQVADDMDCVRIYWYIACHELNTPHVCPHTPHTVLYAKW